VVTSTRKVDALLKKAEGVPSKERSRIGQEKKKKKKKKSRQYRRNGRDRGKGGGGGGGDAKKPQKHHVSRRKGAGERVKE